MTLTQSHTSFGKSYINSYLDEYRQEYLQPTPHEQAFEQLLKTEALKLVPLHIFHSGNYRLAISACRSFYNSIPHEDLLNILHTHYPEYFL